MSWKYGPFTVSTREVVDVDTINESLLAIIEEVTGELNEHNFAEDAFAGVDRTILAEDIGLRLHHEFQEANPNDPPTAAANTPNVVPVSTRWQAVDPTMTKTVTTKGGKLWIMASFQCRTNATYGALFAIEINGVVLGDSLIGSGDIDNDRLDQPSGGGVAPFTFNLGSVPCVWLPNAGALVIEAVVTVSPGQYIIRPVMRNPRLGDNDDQEVSNRELIVLEQR